jgi:hypothetical protein
MSAATARAPQTVRPRPPTNQTITSTISRSSSHVGSPPISTTRSQMMAIRTRIPMSVMVWISPREDDRNHLERFHSVWIPHVPLVPAQASFRNAGSGERPGRTIGLFPSVDSGLEGAIVHLRSALDAETPSLRIQLGLSWLVRCQDVFGLRSQRFCSRHRYPWVRPYS